MKPKPFSLLKRLRTPSSMAQQNQGKSQRAKGVCKRFNNEKGFGFIACDDNSGDVFVHQTEVYADGFRTLAEGEPLEFDIQIQDDGRRKAVNVTGPGGAFVKGQPRDSYGGGGGGGYNRGGGG